MATTQLSSYLRIAGKLLLLGMFLFGASQAGQWITAELEPALHPGRAANFSYAIALCITVYVILLALPFVPGIEVGLGLMIMFGGAVVPLVYAATIFALVLSYLMGRLVPEAAIIRFCEKLDLKRPAELLRQLSALDRQQRIEFLARTSSSRIPPGILRYRFAMLIVALNLPGNSLVGGGGGIGLLVGFSRLFSLPEYVLAVAIAVSPVPLLFAINAG